MLHVHCGDSSAQALRQTGVAGEVIAWCELFTEGPVPADLAGAEWLTVRSQALAAGSGGGLAPAQARAWLERQDQALAHWPEHEEIVLWFDACLYDQTILIRQLDWFARQPLAGRQLSLLCLAAHPAHPRFAGLGELAPAELAALLPQRQPVTPAQFALGRAAWQAFRAPVPQALAALLADGCPALPELAPALRRHLQEFPAVSHGLGRLQTAALQAIAHDGRHDPGGIFRAASAREERPWFGDTTLFACLARLAAGPVPLLSIAGPGPLPCWQPPARLDAWHLDLTPAGRAVLAGTADYVQLNGIDRWHGGVHLQGPDSPWRWDESRGRLQPWP